MIKLTTRAVLQALVDFTETYVSTAEQGQPPQTHAPLPMPCLAACLTILASEGLSLSPSLAPQVRPTLRTRAAAWSACAVLLSLPAFLRLLAIRSKASGASQAIMWTLGCLLSAVCVPAAPARCTSRAGLGGTLFVLPHGCITLPDRARQCCRWWSCSSEQQLCTLCSAARCRMAALRKPFPQTSRQSPMSAFRGYAPPADIRHPQEML